MVENGYELLQQQLDQIRNEIREIKDKLDKQFVTQAQLCMLEEKYKPALLISYGIVGLMAMILSGVIIRWLVK